MRDNRLPHLRPAGHDIDHASRKACFDRQLSQAKRSERSLLRRIHDHSASARQRRPQLPRRKQQRKIPGNDQPDHSNRLPQCVSERRLEGVDRLAVDFRRPTRVIPQDIDDHRHIHISRLEYRLAVVEGLQLGQFVDILLDQIGQLPDQAPALTGRHLAPGARPVLKRFARRLHRAIHVRRRRFCHFSQNLAGRWIESLESFRTLNPFPVDQQTARLDSCFCRNHVHSHFNHGAAGASPMAHYFAVNVAGRFSTYAARPSLASSLWNSSCWFSRSTASADSMGISHPVCTARLIRPTAFAALFGGQNWRAYSMMFSMNPSRSKMSFTMPSSCASSNENVFPVTISSIALLFPMSRDSRCFPPVPGRTPRLTSGKPIWPASLRARRRSAAIAISSPPPTVCPFSAAITSFGVCSRRSSVSLACRQK